MVVNMVRPSLREREERAVRWAARAGIPTLRVAVGMVYLWFGAVKFVPGLSPADHLAVRTIGILTFHVLTGAAARLVLACLETAIGLALVTGRMPRVTLAAFFLHMAGTLTPLVLLPQETWKSPLVATLEGQYIIKNAVLISAGIVLTASLRTDT